MKSQLEHQIFDNMAKDPRNWKGIVYFNKKDPRLIVRKLYPVRGWTFNFASPYSFITMAAIVIIMLSYFLIIK
jgi:uncharacterized membrane protein